MVWQKGSLAAQATRWDKQYWSFWIDGETILVHERMLISWGWKVPNPEATAEALGAIGEWGETKAATIDALRS